MKNKEEKGNILRPSKISEYIGQNKLKTSLSISINASKKMNKSLDHILFYGPAGLGKTTISNLIANEMGVNIKSQSAPSIEKIGDLASILLSLNDNDILFIDEIHRLNIQIEEFLYSAMEDFFIEIITDVSGEKKPYKISLPKFTLIGATTLPGSISIPLRNRFGMQHKLEYYNIDEINTIIKNSALKLNFNISKEAIYEISKRSRGIPRLANKILSRFHEYCVSEKINIKNSKEIINGIMIMTGMNSLGLNESDINILQTLKNKKTMGLKSLSNLSGEDVSNIENVIEPYLIKLELIEKTPKGRIITDKGLNVLKKDA